MNVTTSTPASAAAVARSARFSRRQRVGLEAAPFFERNCLDCHETGTTKGGLNLEKVDPAMSGPEQADLRTSIYDRVAKGEMPPAKRERPPKAEVDQLLAAIRPRLIESDRSPAPSEPFRI